MSDGSRTPRAPEPGRPPSPESEPSPAPSPQPEPTIAPDPFDNPPNTDPFRAPYPAWVDPGQVE